MTQRSDGEYGVVRIDQITQARFPVLDKVGLDEAFGKAERENVALKKSPQRDLHCVVDEQGNIVDSSGNIVPHAFAA